MREQRGTKPVGGTETRVDQSDTSQVSVCLLEREALNGPDFIDHAY